MEPGIRKTIARALLAGHAPATLAAQFNVPLDQVTALAPAPAPEPDLEEEQDLQPPFTAEMEEGRLIDQRAVEAQRMLEKVNHVTSKVVDGEGVLTPEWKTWRIRLRAIRNREVAAAELADGLPAEPVRWEAG